jgi:hypothetical protein
LREPTTERQALDLLLRLHPFYDLIEIDWQLALDDEGEEVRPFVGPWLLVTLGQRSDDGGPIWARHHFAIWKATGAVHGLQEDGSVTDDPLFTV